MAKDASATRLSDLARSALSSLSLRQGWRRAQPEGADAVRAVIELFAENAETAVLIARAYRQSGHRNEGAHQRLGRRLVGAASAAEALARLRSAAHEDLSRGRAFDFDGWVLAEADAEACALLTPEP